MNKSPDAFRTISEVSKWLGVPTHVLRFWESRFDQVAPIKRAGGRRYYRPEDMRLLGGIKVLLHDQGHTIKAVQDRLAQDGPDPIRDLSPGLGEEPGETAAAPAPAATLDPAPAAAQNPATPDAPSFATMRTGSSSAPDPAQGVFFSDLEATAPEPAATPPAQEAEPSPPQAPLFGNRPALQDSPEPQASPAEMPQGPGAEAAPEPGPDAGEPSEPDSAFAEPAPAPATDPAPSTSTAPAPRAPLPRDPEQPDLSLPRAPILAAELRGWTAAELLERLGGPASLTPIEARLRMLRARMGTGLGSGPEAM